MKKVFIFSMMLILGLVASQLTANLAEAYKFYPEVIRILTMICLGFIMIHVGYEFEIDRSNLKAYAVDYGVAATAAAFPWIFCAVYFVLVFQPQANWGDFNAWKEALLAGRFAAPTSAGILFSMLAAAGLSATWYFRKVRILAIFDDLDTVLFMIPLKMLIVGVRWQLAVVVIIMIGLIWLAWKYLHKVKIPSSWPWVITYATAITLISEVVYQSSKVLDKDVPIHIEVLLPAFVLGCLLKRKEGEDVHSDDAREGHQEGPPGAEEQKVATIISGVFMVLVGLSMPVIQLDAASGDTWQNIAFHVLLITIIANLGKMFPLFCYKKEASFKERLALCVGMWPRGEVGAGVLILSLSYGITGTMVTVAVLSLALNLLMTGLFIYWVKALLGKNPTPIPAKG